jgi:hypothetical protein
MDGGSDPVDVREQGPCGASATVETMSVGTSNARREHRNWLRKQTERINKDNERGMSRT